MKDFEVSAEPVQNWLSKAEKAVHENSNRLYDLPAKRREQQKLQVMRPWSRMATCPCLVYNLGSGARLPSTLGLDDATCRYGVPSTYF